jgi:hypothetical protein
MSKSCQAAARIPPFEKISTNLLPVNGMVASRVMQLLGTPAGRNVLVGYRRFLPRNLAGARALSTKTLEKHNVLMEGMPKRSSKGGGIVSCP